MGFAAVVLGVDADVVGGGSRGRFLLGEFEDVGDVLGVFLDSAEVLVGRRVLDGLKAGKGQAKFSCVRYLWGALLIVGLVLGALGVFDKTPTHDSKACPGYHFVRELKTKRQINDFVAVKPAQGWDCEYSLDNEDAEVRFKRTNREIEMEVDGFSSAAYYAANREARAEGFRTSP